MEDGIKLSVIIQIHVLFRSMKNPIQNLQKLKLIKWMHFLTGRTRQPGVKFIIILDRRLDTWASIKAALARIAVSFTFLFGIKAVI